VQVLVQCCQSLWLRWVLNLTLGRTDGWPHGQSGTKNPTFSFY